MRKQNIFKKLLSVALATIMVMGMGTTALAENHSNIEEVQTVNVNGYHFEITEKSDLYGRSVRIYNNNISSRSNDADQTKALLLALGLEQDAINNLSSDALLIYANSPQIQTTTAYSKIDRNNAVTYLDEVTALTESNELQKAQEQQFLQGVSPLATFEDSYMKVVYTTAYKGNASYLFSTDSTWLTMPFFRGTDSIGSCAMNGTVTNNTRKGSYSYDMTTISLGQTSTSRKSGTISSTNFKNAVNGNWYGSAGLIKLPVDIYGDMSSIMYTNYKAHYEYQGHVSSPSEPSWFNTIGSYDHATIKIGGEPSVSIDLNGDVSASIGLSIIGSTDTRSAELEINYKP